MNEASGDDNVPAVHLTWEDALGFCQWGAGRLPTEAEWEYAARAGDTEARYGDPDQIAWHRANSLNIIHEGGQKQANAWGLYDMLGNVLQWTEDWYAPYESSAQRDPHGPTSGKGRTLRGTDLNFAAVFLRASFRTTNTTDFVSTPGALLIGARCVDESVDDPHSSIRAGVGEAPASAPVPVVPVAATPVARPDPASVPLGGHWASKIAGGMNVSLDITDSGGKISGWLYASNIVLGVAALELPFSGDKNYNRITSSYTLHISEKDGTLEIVGPTTTYRRTAFGLVWHPADGGAPLFDGEVSRVGDSQPHR